MEENNKQSWHTLDYKEVIRKLESDSENGLSEKEIQKRLKDYGLNKMPTAKKKHPLIKFLLQFHNTLIYILIVAAVITALMDHWIDTWVIAAVVIINAMIGFVQEGKAEQALDNIKNMLSLRATVIREGKQQHIGAEELVPGDIVKLKSGDKVPADIRIIEAKNLQVEESALTGESTAVEKNTRPVKQDDLLGDQKGMAFSGTVVMQGNCKAIVIATGEDTEIGKINTMMSEVEKITTPLLQQIERLGKLLSFIILGITALFFAFGYFFRDYELSELFLAAIGLIVAAIPEGLPAIMTITLAIGVQQMAKRNAIIRKLPSVETLGSVSIICSDKTGTLTRNEMTARQVSTAEDDYQIEGTGYQPKGEIKKNNESFNYNGDRVFNRLMLCLLSTCNSFIEEKSEGEWTVSGTPTEGALLSLSLKAGFESFKTKRLDSIPFESEHKFTVSKNRIEDQDFLFLTGAPEIVIELCTKQYTANSTQSLDLEYWEKKSDEAASKGLRILAAAFKITKDKQDLTPKNVDKDFIFLGIIGIIDPPRDEVIQAIKECKSAGVKVKMITGDHAATAKTIGYEIGIGDGKRAMTGQEIESLNDDELKNVVLDNDIYARTTPKHKLRLVKALQANNKLCAMTGDGVNDAPALKKANIGIAMGIKGTEVTKDASEMVLADDNFASIVSAIKEGRTVYDNIQKALFFILPTNGAESLVLMAAVILNITMPITAAQILWVNMVTAVTLALALSFEPAEENVMCRPPRNPDAPILGKEFLWKVVYVSIIIGFFTISVFNYLYNQIGLSENEARTVAVNTLVCCQLFYLFNCRKTNESAIGKDFFGNRYVFYAAGLLTLLQIGFVYLPFMNNLFDTAAIDLKYWIHPFIIGIAVFMIVEIEKWISQKIKTKSEA